MLSVGRRLGGSTQTDFPLRHLGVGVLWGDAAGL